MDSSLGTTLQRLRETRGETRTDVALRLMQAPNAVGHWSLTSFCEICRRMELAMIDLLRFAALRFAHATRLQEGDDTPDVELHFLTHVERYGITSGGEVHARPYPPLAPLRALPAGVAHE